MIPKDSSLWSPGILGGPTNTTTGTATVNNRNTVGITGGASSPAAASCSNNYAFLSATTTTTTSVLLQGSSNGMGGNHTALIQASVGDERPPELCKYFLNGGCIRGAQCQFLHELPDERHLDLNGCGYILNPNVHNAQKTHPFAASNSTSSNVNTNNNNNNNNAGAVQVNSGATTSSPLMLGLNTGNTRQPLVVKGKQQSSFMVGVPTHLPFQISTSSVKVPPPKYRPPEPFLEYNLPPTLALPFNTPPKEVATQLTHTMLQN